MRPDDWPAVREIYAEGIATGNATLELEPPIWEAFDKGHLAEARLVATLDGRVVAWFALSRYSRREVYSGVAWESIYVAGDLRGRGVGRRLLEAAIPVTEELGFWTLIAGVHTENVASLAVHERTGFRRIGIQERIGRDRTGRWRDVVLLERRSPKVAV